MELGIKNKIQDHSKNQELTPETKLAYNKILGCIAIKLNQTAVTKTTRHYVKNNDVQEKSQDALTHMVELKRVEFEWSLYLIVT